MIGIGVTQLLTC